MIKDEEQKSGDQRTFQLNEIPIIDGEAVILRTAQSGKVWQFRTWIHSQQKYYRKSLRTKSKDAAIAKGRELYLQINHRARKGETIFSIKFSQLVKSYFEEQKKRVRIDQVGYGDVGITEGRLRVMESITRNHIVPFIGEDTKLDAIKGEDFENEYARWRRDKNPEVRNSTVQNEKVVIKNMFKWGQKKRMVAESAIPIFEKVRRSLRVGIDTRVALEPEEWTEVWRYMRGWNKGITDTKELEKRDFVKDFILILANSGLRVGECRWLRWENVKLVKQNEEKIALLDIYISKTKPRLGITCRSSYVFLRIKKYSQHTSPRDFVFVDNDTGKMISGNIYYQLWKEIVENTSLKTKTKRPTYYCLRHMFITFSLMKDIPVFDIAEQTGTSVHHIETTYGHLKRQQRSHLFMRDLPKNEAIEYLME